MRRRVSSPAARNATSASFIERLRPDCIIHPLAMTQGNGYGSIEI